MAQPRRGVLEPPPPRRAAGRQGLGHARLSDTEPPVPDPRPIRGDTIVQRGRAKAYRPLPLERRREILAEGLAAYDRGDFFLAHELLEPAWMGASDPAERNLYQGLIKLAAAFVHDVRGNPAGVRKNLLGARDLLMDALAAGPAAGIDVPALITEVDACLSDSSTGSAAALAVPRNHPIGLRGGSDERRRGAT